MCTNIALEKELFFQLDNDVYYVSNWVRFKFIKCETIGTVKNLDSVSDFLGATLHSAMFELQVRNPGSPRLKCNARKKVITDCRPGLAKQDGD